MESEQPGLTPQPKGVVMRVHTIAVIAACVILLVVAFLAGILVATNGYRVGVDDDIVVDGDLVSDQDDENNEPIDTAETIAMDWLTFSKFETRGYDPRLYATTIGQEESMVVESTTGIVVGTVAEGEYEGWSVIANISGQASLGTYYKTIYTLGSPDVDMDGQSTEYVVLNSPLVTGYFSGTGGITTVSDMYPDADVPLVDITLTGIMPESEIVVDGVTYIFADVGINVTYPETVEYRDMDYIGNSDEYGALRIFTLDTNETAPFSGTRNAFYVVSRTGQLFWYDIEIPFWTSTEDRRSGVPAVVIDGATNSATYLKGKVGGCGFQDMTDVVTDVPELTAVGYALADDEVLIYEPKDYTLTMFDDEYTSWSAMHTDSDNSRAAFAAIHPLFFYQDAIGRWIQFTKVDVVPPGECGKPVIYLYPETTTKIDVSLAPKGGFTKSEPAYNDGWHVVAEPNGQLLNLGDGVTYPYLFWEGRGGMYSEPTKYWVVAQADVHTFLVSTLARLGLNTQETADFMEFWEPRMQGAPYYKIGFHGTNVMNAIAPMKLSQSADTLVRILMDFSELSSPLASNPPMLPATPVRKGFTVIEWGGVIR